MTYLWHVAIIFTVITLAVTIHFLMRRLDAQRRVLEALLERLDAHRELLKVLNERVLK